MRLTQQLVELIKSVEEVHSYTDCYEPLMELMATLPPDEKVILVSHRYGGYGLSIPMEAFPEKIDVSVFVADNMPGPDLTYLTISQEIYNKVLESFKEDIYYTVYQNSDGRVISYILKPKALASKLYQLSPTEMTEKKEEHFVLVHGGCHGAWCWYKVATQLRSEGHRVTTLDLAACGINQKSLQEVQSYRDYFQPLLEFMATLPLDKKVVLVGHSFGGYGLSLAMETFPEKISVAVFVTALMPGPDLTYLAISREIKKVFDSFGEEIFTFEQSLDERIISYIFRPEALASKLYQLSPAQDLTLANLLARPHPAQTDTTAPEVLRVSKERHGSVGRIYVMADQDILLPEEIQRWMIQLNPPNEVKVIQGSDHMTMFSKPRELCSCLLAIAPQYC